MGDAANAAVFLAEEAVLGGEGIGVVVGVNVGRNRISVLMGPALKVGVGRKKLMREIGGHARFLLAIILGDAFREQGQEIGMSLHQAHERFAIEGEKLRVVHRLRRGAAGQAADERELAEEIALAAEGEIFLPLALRGENPDPAALDDVHRPGRIALADDQIALRE